MSEATFNRLVGKFDRAEKRLKQSLRSVKKLLPPDTCCKFVITPLVSLNQTPSGAAQLSTSPRSLIQPLLILKEGDIRLMRQFVPSGVAMRVGRYLP